MKLHLLLLPVALLLVNPSILMSQTLPNAGLETWVSSGRPAPFNWEEPQGWKSTNAVTEFIAAGITKSNDAFLGSSAADIRSLNIFGSNVPGILAIGDPPLDFANNTLIVEKGGIPFATTISSMAISLSGYYKFTGATATDSAFAVVLLKRYNTINNKIDTVGLGELLLGAQTNYTSFTVPITYIDSINAPDSVVIAFYSSNPMNPQANNMNSTGLKIDQIALDFSTNIVENKGEDLALEIFPNPFSTSFSIRSKTKHKGAISIYSITGRLVQSNTLLEKTTITEVNTENLQPGIYFIEISDENGKKKRQKLIKS